ncbi:MAG: TolC family protein [Rhodospirillaceae bacterium]|nr:TolC family protein [Rhodospirillaceae bacterium]
MRQVLLKVSLLCWGVMTWSAAEAQTTAAPQFSLQDVLRLTAESDPRLRGQAFLRQEAGARERQAALRPAAKLGLEAENILGTGSIGAFNDAELTLSLGATLELSNKRAQRMAVAASETQRQELDLQAVRLDIMADAARRFIAVLQAQEMLRIAAADKVVAGRARQIVATRVSSGVALPVERSNAEVAGIQAELAEQQALSSLKAAWGRLVMAWGGAPESSGAARGDLFAASVLPPFAGLQELVERNPDIARFATERRLREAAVKAAEAQATPDVDVSAGVRRFQATRDQAFVVSAAIPMGTVGRAAPAADEARSRLGGLAAEEQAHRQDVLATLFGLREQAAAARMKLELLQSGALPAATRAQEQAEAAFRAGRSSLLELNAAQRQLLDLQRDKIGTAGAYHLLVIDIERLIGQPLAAASP